VVLKGFITYCESGKCGLFVNGGLIMFDVSSVTMKYQFADLLPVVILGVIGGFVGAVYNYLLGRTLRLYALINEYDFRYCDYIRGLDLVSNLQNLCGLCAQC